MCHSIGFFAHAVAGTNQDLKTLIAAATEFTGPGFLVFEPKVQGRLSNDVDEQWPVQRTYRRLLAVCVVPTVW